MTKFDFGEEAKLTNEELADELAKQTPLTADELKSLLPRKIDKERFEKLIEIVGGAASQNAKLAALESNLAEVGPVLLKVFGHLLKLA